MDLKEIGFVDVDWFYVDSPGLGSCEHGTEASGCIKAGSFLALLSHFIYQDSDP
jgi:hypothetical protein